MKISITEGELQIDNSHLKRCSISLIIKEISENDNGLFCLSHW